MIRQLIFRWGVTFFILCCGSLLGGKSEGQQFYREALVRIQLPERWSWQYLIDQGIDPDHSWYKGDFLLTPLPVAAIPVLQQQGYKVEIIISDLTDYYQERNGQQTIVSKYSSNDPPGFQLGTMGGFYRYTEIWEQFQRLQERYPRLIHGPDTIGWSVEDRPIILYRIGTDSALQRDVPKILFTAVHHAREPGGITTIVYFLWWLFHQYALGNQEIYYLLNNRQLFVVPLVNPDGYVFNEQIAPEGGGMWRKNRRPIQSNIYGVDLNRNYGPRELWDAPQGGSSDNPMSNTYRGTEPFSEPETQAIRDLCLQHHFAVAFNYHTFSNLYIYPWAALGRETADWQWFRGVSRCLSRYNRYCFGLDHQTVGYNARGVSDDWMYYAMESKPSIFAITPEVGSFLDGFWPAEDRIIPLARSNVWPNLQLLWSAGVNVRPIMVFPVDTVAKICVEFQNLGRVDAPDTLQWEVVEEKNRAEFLPAAGYVPPLKSTQVWRDTVVIVDLAPSVQPGDTLKLILTLWQEGVARRDTVIIRNPNGARYHWLFRDEQDWKQWQSSTWDIAVDSLRGAVMSDSPNGVYLKDTVLVVELRSPIDLSAVERAQLSFWTRWEIEPSFDFAVVEVSTDGGRNWQTLRTSRMDRAEGVGFGRQHDTAQWGFEGFFPFWIYQSCSLDPYRGKQLRLRFRLLTDPGRELDGWFLDDVLLTVFPSSISTAVKHKNGQSQPQIVYREGKLYWHSLIPGRVYSAALYTMTGRRIWTASIASSDGFCNLPSLLPGIYVIQLHTQTEEPLSIRRIIVVGWNN